MTTGYRLTKRVLFNSSTTLHFILSQRVTLAHLPPSPLWIDTLEGVKGGGYDVTRCLEQKSPLNKSVREVIAQSGEQVGGRGEEDGVQQKWAYGGRISIVPENPVKDGELHDQLLRIAVLNKDGKSTLSAILHDPDMASEAVAALFGVHSFMESSIATQFSGITGLSWSPIIEEALPNQKEEPNTNNSEALETQTSSSPPEAPVSPHPDPQSDTQIPGVPHKLESLPRGTIKEIAELTTGQGNSGDDVWLRLRQKRLTASMFGLVLQAIENERYPQYLFNSLLNRQDLSKVPAIRWGTENEDNAKRAYEQKTGSLVEESGLWLHTCGILGASPDGLLADGRGIVEFKCPFSIRDITVEEAIERNNRFYLQKDADGVVQLKKKHPYYHQIQGMLYIIDREYCDFCVWTPVSEPYILRIAKDPSWEPSIAKLINFYFRQLLPRVLGKEEENCLFEGYKDMVKVIDQVLTDTKQKRLERKERMSSSIPSSQASSPTSSPEFPSLPTLSPEDVLQIAALTSSPFSSSHPKTWWAMREHRLTSSSFHDVLSAVKRGSYSESLFKKIMEEYFARNMPIMKLTRTNTSRALARYETERDLALVPSGIWLDTSGLLGSSITALVPDGEGIVDVRCLFKYKGITDVGQIAGMNDPNFHLEHGENGKLQLKQTHRVYTKVQGSLHLSGRQYCDQITWTDAVYHVTRVSRDPDWGEKSLPFLLQFFRERLFPRLCDKWGRDNVVKDLTRFAKNNEA